MKTLAEHAIDAILAAGLISKDRIEREEINYAEWDGKPRIVVIEEESTVEEYQLGPLYQTTPLIIRCCAKERGEALALCQQAATAVYQHLALLIRYRKGGVISVDRTGQGSGTLQSATAYEASRNFRVLNTMNM